MKRSIVMMDWSRSNTPTAATRDQFLWEQMLLSILYDDVYAQDQTVLLSNKLASWFGDAENFGLLTQLVDSGGIKLLKHPVERYPAALQEKVERHPIAARREFLENYSNDNEGRKITFDDRLLLFHHRLEALFIERAQSQRFAGALNLSTDLMVKFRSDLKNILSDRRYDSWIAKEFPTIGLSTREAWYGLIGDPAAAIKKIRESRITPKEMAAPLPEHATFNKALAAQLAATYSHESADLRKLIETVFAGAFCDDEGAEGRYDRLLRPIPIVSANPDGQVEKIVRLENLLRVPLKLPLPDANFGEVINELRRSESVRHLRKVLELPDDGLAFSRVQHAWQAVADDLAAISASRKMKEISIHLLLLEARNGFLWGVVADLAHGMLRGWNGMQDFLLKQVSPVAGAGLSVGGTLFKTMFTAGLTERHLARKLEEAVEFKCVPHPVISNVAMIHRGVIEPRRQG